MAQVVKRNGARLLVCLALLTGSLSLWLVATASYVLPIDVPISGPDSEGITWALVGNTGGSTLCDGDSVTCTATVTCKKPPATVGLPDHYPNYELTGGVESQTAFDTPELHWIFLRLIASAPRLTLRWWDSVHGLQQTGSWDVIKVDTPSWASDTIPTQTLMSATTTAIPDTLQVKWTTAAPEVVAILDAAGLPDVERIVTSGDTVQLRSDTTPGYATIRVESNSSPPCPKEKKLCVVRVDVSFDDVAEDWNNTVPPDNELTPGEFIALNDNDDDGRPGIDKDVAADTLPLSVADPDLKLVTVDLLPSGIKTGVVKLTATSGLRLWRTDIKDKFQDGDHCSTANPTGNGGCTEVTWDLASSVPPWSMPQDLYGEGYNAGSDETLTVTYDGSTPEATDVVNVTVFSLDGLRVYDPKLENAGSAEVKYRIDSLTEPRLELTVMDGTTEVACLVRKTDSSPAIGTEITKNWDGKWGTKKDGTDTADKGKYADPKKYKVELVVYRSAAATTPLYTKEYDLYVVRLGVTEVKFDSQGANEWYKLQYHISKDADDDDGKAEAAEHYAVPQSAGALQDVVWRLGDEATNSANVDITSGADKGKARNEEAPYTETFYPPQDSGTAGAVENDSFNYPICYKAGSRIKIKVRTSNGGYSPVLDRVLSAGELGYDSAKEYKVNAYVKWGTKDLDVITANANKAIDPNEEIVLESKAADKLGTAVDIETLNMTYTWKYEKNGVEKEIPGKFTSSHRAYLIVGPPQLPWNASADATRPWIAAMDYAVAWAHVVPAATDVTTAAKKITEKVYSGLGLTYNMVDGDCNYGNANILAFKLANLLLFLKTGNNVEAERYTHRSGHTPQSANTVNCSDCSCITSAFAAVLGCDVVITHIDGPSLLNEIQAIGQTGFGYPDFGDPGVPKGFSYHAFMTRNAQADVYDACLKVGRPDPSVPATRTGSELPAAMTFDIPNAAGHGPVTFVAGGGSSADGTLTIDSVFEGSTMNDSFSIECTAVDATGALFGATSGCSGTGSGKVGPATGATVTFNVALNAKSTARVTITQGTDPFCVGDKFTFDTTFNYDEYRGSLAAPDCAGYGAGGRTSVGYQAGSPYTISVVK